MMNKPYDINRAITWLGHATFGVLAILALVFWRERTMMLDASFQSFDIINNGKLAIQVQRFGAAFVQSFPLLTSKLGLPLYVVLMSYSLAFVLFHWLAFFICDKILRVKEMALGVLLWYVLMTAHTFYWAQNEVIQGISLCFVYFALLLNRKEFPKLRWYDYPLSIGLVFTLVYFHPLIIFPFCFMWGYFFVDKMPPLSILWKKNQTPKPSKLSWGLLGWSILGFALANYVKFYVTGLSPYDKGSSERFNNHIVRPLKELLRGPSQKLFWGHCFDDFALVLPFFLLIIGVYVWKKSLLKALFFLFAAFGLIFIIATSYFDSKDWFYLESQYLPLAVMLAIPFIFDVLPQIKNVKWALGIVSFILVFKILYILQTHKPYTQRLNYLTEMLSKTTRFEGTKFFIDHKDIDEKKLLMYWGCAYETLYISATQSPDSTRSLYVAENAGQTLWITGGKKNFFTIFDNIEYHKTNKRYFNFQDTTRGYKLLERKDFDSIPNTNSQ
ncbi:MAG: hypothetical protein JNL70_19695 [Saprospiraceae bacterium]|nr:hypothetical protein [Saprospiraceae bacterium]